MGFRSGPHVLDLLQILFFSVSHGTNLSYHGIDDLRTKQSSLLVLVGSFIHIRFNCKCASSMEGKLIF